MKSFSDVKRTKIDNYNISHAKVRHVDTIYMGFPKPYNSVTPFLSQE